MSFHFLHYRKKYRLKVLLYVHINLSLALLLGLIIFIAGIEAASSIDVSEQEKKYVHT